MTALEVIAERLAGLRDEEAFEAQERANRPRSVTARYHLHGTRRVIGELQNLAEAIRRETGGDPV